MKFRMEENDAKKLLFFQNLNHSDKSSKHAIEFFEELAMFLIIRSEQH